MKKDNKFFCNLCKQEIEKGKGYSFANPNYHLHQEPCFIKLTTMSKYSRDSRYDITPDEQNILREQLKEFMKYGR